MKPEEYISKLVEHGIMKIYAIATVVETNETWANEDSFMVPKPNLDIEVNSMLLWLMYIIYVIT